MLRATNPSMVSLVSKVARNMSVVVLTGLRAFWAVFLFRTLDTETSGVMIISLSWAELGTSVGSTVYLSMTRDDAKGIPFQRAIPWIGFVGLLACSSVLAPATPWVNIFGGLLAGIAYVNLLKRRDNRNLAWACIGYAALVLALLFNLDDGYFFLKHFAGNPWLAHVHIILLYLLQTKSSNESSSSGVHWFTVTAFLIAISESVYTIFLRHFASRESSDSLIMLFIFQNYALGVVGIISGYFYSESEFSWRRLTKYCIFTVIATTLVVTLVCVLTYREITLPALAFSMVIAIIKLLTLRTGIEILGKGDIVQISLTAIPSIVGMLSIAAITVMPIYSLSSQMILLITMSISLLLNVFIAHQKGLLRA